MIDIDLRHFILKKKNIIILFILLITSIFIARNMYLLMHHGVGVSPDSTIYLDGAYNILHSQKYMIDNQYISHFPPEFSTLLAITTWSLNISVINATRLINAFLFSLNFILFVLIVYACSKQNSLTSLFTGLFYLSSCDILLVSSMAWSEVPFITLLFISLITLVLYLKTNKKYYLFITSFTISISILTRYVGFALIPTVIFSLLFLSNESLKNKIRKITVFLFITFSVLSFWFIRNIIYGNSVANRSFNIHFITLSHIKNLIVTTQNFIVNVPFSPWSKSIILLLFILIIICIVIYNYKSGRILFNFQNVDILFPIVCTLFSLFYFFLIIISISFIDALTPCDFRIFLPCFIVLFIPIIYNITLFIKHSKSYNIRIILSIIFIGFILMNFLNTYKLRAHIYNNGLGFTSVKWQQSKLISIISNANPDLIIYTNAPNALKFLTKKNIVMLPCKYSSLSLKNNLSFHLQMNKLKIKCNKQIAIIVYFYKIPRSNMPSIDDIMKQNSNLTINKYQDGVCLGYKIKETTK